MLTNKTPMQLMAVAMLARSHVLWVRAVGEETAALLVRSALP